jgi:hypothetical protein
MLHHRRLLLFAISGGIIAFFIYLMIVLKPVKESKPLKDDGFLQMKDY